MSESAAPWPDDPALGHEIIRQQAETIAEARRRIEQLEHQVEQLLRRQYGPGGLARIRRLYALKHAAAELFAEARRALRQSVATPSTGS